MMPSKIKQKYWYHILITTIIFVFSIVTAHSNATIKALVNDAPVTAYDVEQRAKFTRLATQQKLNNALRKKALEELIDEQLKLQMMREMGMSLDYAATEKQFETIAARSKLSPQKFEQLIRQSGVDPQTFKDRIAVNIAWQGIVRQRFRRDIGTRRDELQSIMEEQSGTGVREEVEYELAQVIVIAPGGSKSAVASAKRVASQIRSNFTSCSTGRQNLKSISNAIYKPIGLRRASELQPKALSQLEGVADGQLGAPEVTANGVEMVAICSRRDVTTEGVIDKDVENEVLNKEFDILARRLIRDMRQDAVIEYR